MSIFTETENRIQSLTEYLTNNSDLKVQAINYFGHVVVIGKDNDPYIVLKYFTDDSKVIELHSKGFRLLVNGFKLHDGENYKDFSTNEIIEEYDNDKLFSIMTVYSAWYLREFIEKFELQKVLQLIKF